MLCSSGNEFHVYTLSLLCTVCIDFFMIEQVIYIHLCLSFTLNCPAVNIILAIVKLSQSILISFLCSLLFKLQLFENISRTKLYFLIMVFP